MSTDNPDPNCGKRPLAHKSKAVAKPLNKIRPRSECSFLKGSERKQKHTKFRMPGGLPPDSTVVHIQKS